MNNRFTRFAPSLLALAIAAGSGIALTAVADAQTAAPPAAATPPMPPHPPMGPGGAGMRGGHMMKEAERLKVSLKLNASQTALWDKAQQQMKPPMDLREQMKTRRDRMAAMLDDPGFDPRKMAAEMDSAEADRHAKMAGIRDAWFAFYDSLNPVQRGQVREFLRSHMGRPHGMGGHDGWMHGRGGEDGHPPGMPMSH